MNPTSKIEYNSNTSFPRNILLIEDNPADIRLIEEVFQEDNAKNELNCVNDGTDALNYLYKECEIGSRQYPNLIILDLNMPKMNGIEFLKKIKSDEKLSNIPKIVFTTSSLDENREECINMGANEYITKPTDFEGFRHIIKQLRKFNSQK